MNMSAVADIFITICALIKNAPMARFLFGFRFNGNSLAVTKTFFELHDARDFCEQCVILAHANIQARVHRCATLANNDITWDNTAATGFLNT